MDICLGCGLVGEKAPIPPCFLTRRALAAHLCFFPGEVVLLVPMPADGPADSWQLLPDGRAASPTTSFTQQDINDGVVWYRHSGSEVESDSFQFQVLLSVFTGRAAVPLAFFSELTQSAVPSTL